MWRGRVFQTLGAETRKAREPNERLWRGTKSSWVEDERVDFGVVWNCTMSARYGGWPVVVDRPTTLWCPVVKVGLKRCRNSTSFPLSLLPSPTPLHSPPLRLAIIIIIIKRRFVRRRNMSVDITRAPYREKIGPLNRISGSGERCKLPQRGLGQPEPQRKSN